MAIGVGGMVGGGIFAVLGLSVQITRGGAPLAYLLAGLVALLTARSYALLSKTYPSRGGTVTFVNRAFGAGPFTGSINILLWLSYIVMLALYASAFGSYAAIFFPSAARGTLKHVFMAAVIVAIGTERGEGLHCCRGRRGPTPTFTHAYYISVLFVIALHVLISVVASSTRSIRRSFGVPRWRSKTFSWWQGRGSRPLGRGPHRPARDGRSRAAPCGGVRRTSSDPR